MPVHIGYFIGELDDLYKYLKPREFPAVTKRQ